MLVYRGFKFFIDFFSRGDETWLSRMEAKWGKLPDITKAEIPKGHETKSAGIAVAVNVAIEDNVSAKTWLADEIEFRCYGFFQGASRFENDIRSSDSLAPSAMNS